MFNSFIIQKTGLILLLSIVLLVVSGCGISRRTVVPNHDGSGQSGSTQPAPPAMDLSAVNEEVSSIRQQLRSAHQKWEGTPYLLGGNGSDGIDCSAFTQTVFRDYFETDLPRHTRSQLQAGTGVRRGAIQTGDLIFFRTGRKTLHVGIAMGNGNFLHASRSSGVMISSLNEPYWATRYLGARRVL